MQMAMNVVSLSLQEGYFFYQTSNRRLFLIPTLVCQNFCYIAVQQSL